MKLRLTKNRTVCDFCKPYIIAELASNHNGDMRLARRLILQAKKAGADCVKFQSWSKDTIFSKKVYKQNYFLKDDYRKRKDYTLEKIVDKFSISFRQLLAMKKYADKLGIDCIASPFAKKEVDFLVEELKVNFIKIASMDLNNYSFLEYIGKKGLPILLSTGLSSLPEIDRAIKTIIRLFNFVILAILFSPVPTLKWLCHCPTLSCDISNFYFNLPFILASISVCLSSISPSFSNTASNFS